MMKQLIIMTIMVLGIGVFSARGQVYQASAGLGLDFGDGLTQTGFSGKYFLGENHGLQGELLFGSVTGMNFLYAFHDGFPGAEGLQWFVGGGIGVLLGNGNSDVGLRPMAGLDYKLADIPLGFTFDWRPYISFDSGSTAGRFGIGIRYIWE